MTSFSVYFVGNAIDVVLICDKNSGPGTAIWLSICATISDVH